MLEASRVITIVHFDGVSEEYTSTVIDGVSVHQRVEHSLKDKGVVAAMVTTVRIPEENLPEVLPKAGDFVIFDRALVIAERRDIDQYGHAVVMGVGDNRRGGIPHLKLTCR